MWTVNYDKEYFVNLFQEFEDVWEGIILLKVLKGKISEYPERKKKHKVSFYTEWQPLLYRKLE